MTGNVSHHIQGASLKQRALPRPRDRSRRGGERYFSYKAPIIRWANSPGGGQMMRAPTLANTLERRAGHVDPT
jgi:hypothetical protein